MRISRLVLSTLCLAAALLASQATVLADESESGGRVDFPRAGFAITYPDGWRLEATGTGGPVMHQANDSWSDQGCRAYYRPAPASSGETAQGIADWAAANGLEASVQTGLSLPVGEATRVDYRNEGFDISDYYVEVPYGGVANLECYASERPDHRWLPIAATIATIPVEETSADGGPPISRFEFEDRVVLPEVGFAMDFPAEWQVRGSSTPLLGEAIREVLEASTDDANCRVVDASRLFAGHGEDGLASMHEPRLEARSQGEWRLLDSGYLDLPVGRVGQVVYENRHGPAEQTYADYSLTDGDTSVTLQCVGDKRPEDDWLSIVKTFEFLPAEE